MIKAIIALAAIIVAIGLFIEILQIWINALDSTDKEYWEYCHGCKNGFCTEIPRSKNCDKWRQEHENHDK